MQFEQVIQLDFNISPLSLGSHHQGWAVGLLSHRALHCAAQNEQISKALQVKWCTKAKANTAF